MAKDKELADHERAHSGQPGAKVRHGADATGNPGGPVTVIHNDRGASYGPRAYRGEVRRDKRMSTTNEAYALGKDPHNYPMPVVSAKDD